MGRSRLGTPVSRPCKGNLAAPGIQAWRVDCRFIFAVTIKGVQRRPDRRRARSPPKSHDFRPEGHARSARPPLPRCSSGTTRPPKETAWNERPAFTPGTILRPTPLRRSVVLRQCSPARARIQSCQLLDHGRRPAGSTFEPTGDVHSVILALDDRRCAVDPFSTRSQ